MLGAFAAVGVVLAAGLQIASLGDLTLDDPGRFWTALAGVFLAIVGIVVAVASAASVASSSHVTLAWIRNNATSDAAKAVDDDSALRLGKQLGSLESELETAAQSAASAYERLLEIGAPGADDASQRAAATAKSDYQRELGRLEWLRSIRTDVLGVASYSRVRAAFNAARWGMCAGAFVTAVGIALFAWGANAPEQTSLDGGTVVPPTPSEVTVMLTDEGVEEFGGDLGRECKFSRVEAIAFALSGTAYDVVSVQTDDCAVVRMSVTDTLGRVIPRIPGDDGDDADE